MRIFGDEFALSGGHRLRLREKVCAAHAGLRKPHLMGSSGYSQLYVEGIMQKGKLQV